MGRRHAGAHGAAAEWPSIDVSFLPLDLKLPPTGPDFPESSSHRPLSEQRAPVVGGIRSLVVADEQVVRRVYPILEPASGYYSTTTKSAWMPCLGRMVSGKYPESAG